MYTSLTSLICLIKWMTIIFIMLKMSNYNGDHMHENSLLFFAHALKASLVLRAQINYGFK